MEQHPHKPKVSVVMPTYNRAKDYLPKAIESVINQTLKDWELIIVDDGSKDNTDEVALGYARKDDRIIYIKKGGEAGTGGCTSRNIAISYSKGEYISYLDDDNEFLPYNLEIMSRFLDRNKDIDVAYCDMELYTEGQEPMRGIAMDFNAQLLLKRNYIDTSEIMHRRQAIFNIGGWDQEIPRFTDWNICVRMMKQGSKFQRVPIVGTKYYSHKVSKTGTVEVETYFDPQLQMTMFKPIGWDPVSCPIYQGNLMELKQEETSPKVAIFTLTYDRLEYTKRMYASMKSSTNYPFDWFVFDQGSTDGTGDFLMDEAKPRYVHLNGRNVGITKASNHLIDKIKALDYQIIIKVDNDCEFLTKGWLEDLVQLWKINHNLYMSPYPEGLVSNPGGAPRVGYSHIGKYPIEVTNHIGGFCAFADAKAYDTFRWTDQFKHGDQDSEISAYLRERGYMPCYIPTHRVYHIDTTAGQQEKFKEYFERRKKEKTEVAE